MAWTVKRIQEGDYGCEERSEELCCGQRGGPVCSSYYIHRWQNIVWKERELAADSGVKHHRML